MTRKEYKKIRGEYRPEVKAAFIEFRILNERSFVITDELLSLYNECWNCLQRAARALKCTEKQVAEMLNII